MELHELLSKVVRLWCACGTEAGSEFMTYSFMWGVHEVTWSLACESDIDRADEALQRMLHDENVPNRLLVMFVILDELMFRADDEGIWATLPSMCHLSEKLNIPEPVLRHLYNYGTDLQKADPACKALAKAHELVRVTSVLSTSLAPHVAMEL